MTDIANIGFSADTSELAEAKSSIQALVPAAKDAEKASGRLGAVLGKVDAAADKLAAAASGLNAATDKLSRALDRQGNSASKAARGLERENTAANQAARGVRALGAAVDAAAASHARTATGVRNFGEALGYATSSAGRAAMGVHNLGIALEQVGTRSSVQAARGVRNLGIAIEAAAMQHNRMFKYMMRENLNLSRQFADIGVTAAMGMNPLMIAIQQGPQLLDIFQEKAIVTGTTIREAFMSSARAIWAAMLPFMPFIIGIGLAVAGVAAAFKLMQRSVNQSIGSNIDHLKLNERQMERLEDAGTELGVTLGDVFRGIGTTIKETINNVIGEQIDWLGGKWSNWLDEMNANTVNDMKAIVGLFAGAFFAIRNIWGQLPAAMADQTTLAVNAALRGITFLVNRSIDAMNLLNRTIGIDRNISHIDTFQFSNDNVGAAANASASAAAGWAEGRSVAGTFVDESIAATQANIAASRDARVLEAAGRAGRNSASGGKTDAERFDDIVRRAEGDIATQRARAAALGLTAEATATLEQRTKLLNQVSSRNIPLTDGMRERIDELAAAYGRAVYEADRAEFVFNMGRDADAEIAALEAEAQGIGLVGSALYEQTRMAELLAQAKDENIIVDAEMLAMFERIAGRYAQAAASNDAARFYNDAMRSQRQAIDMLEAERVALGMNDIEASAYLYTQQMLNDARARGIELTPDEIASLGSVAKEYSRISYEINLTREATELIKGTTRSFVDDMRNGLEQGKSFWSSFADAVVNALGRIADKMLDLAFDNLFAGAGGGGGILGGIINGFAGLFGGSVGATAAGGSLDGFFAKGAAFGATGIEHFAKGSAFSNTVIGRPTLFSFANGTALGEMGEAGPEAIMPLTRGPDGSLGVQMYGGGAGVQRVALDVSVTGEEGEMFVPRIKAISRDEAVTVTREGIRQYDSQMPARVNEIASDGRVR